MKYVPRKIPYAQQKTHAYTISNEGISYNNKPKRDSVIDKDNIVQSIWNLWCLISQRDDTMVDSTISKKISESIVDWENAPDHQIETLVRSALYLPPKVGDTEDVLRLCSVFTSSQSRKTASEYMNNIMMKPYYRDDIKSMEEKIGLLLEELNIEDFNSISDKEQSSIMALSTIDIDDVKEMISVARKSFPDEIKPSDVVMIGKDINSLYPATSDDNLFQHTSKRRSRDKDYVAGREEDDSLFSDTMEADLDASQMIIAGYPEEDIIAFHKDVPRGYWAKVLHFVEQGEDDIRGIYDELDKEFRWHPSDRRKPKLL